MRELTDAELELVGGGAGNEDVVVYGLGQSWSSYFYSLPASYSSGTPTSHTGPAGSAGSAPNNWTAALDTSIDNAGKSIAQRIAQIADHDTKEYGAWIYLSSDGQVHQSTIVAGTESVSPFGKPLSDFNVPSGSVLVGQIHNHPGHNLDGQVLENRAYPDNYDLNAIATAGNYAVPSSNIKVDTSVFRGYIMHDNVVDEYDAVTHQGPYDISSGQTKALPNTSKDATFAI